MKQERNAIVLDLSHPSRTDRFHAAPLEETEPSFPNRDSDPTANREPSKKNLIGLSQAQLRECLQEIGVPSTELSMRVSQLRNWIYVRGVSDFASMTTISKALRTQLDQHFHLQRPQVVQQQISTDGTRKWLLQTADSQPGASPLQFEMVFIPDADRGTLCISSQIGCTLTCSFCHTGTQRLVRNLTTEEITGQILLAKDALQEWPCAEKSSEKTEKPKERFLTNIVLMGMGEPLYNFENVRDAIRIAADNSGMNFSRRRITLSTSGVVPKIPLWGAETDTMLAISLHATNDALRNQLVPINKKYPIASLLEACRAYPGLSNARRITFEYVMLQDVNDSDQDARELVRLLAKIPAKINLIPFNPWEGSRYTCSSPERIESFARILNAAGYASPVRTPRGRDIMAACGQLKSQSQKLPARLRNTAEETRSSCSL